jgi:hypothetical protein
MHVISRISIITPLKALPIVVLEGSRIYMQLCTFQLLSLALCLIAELGTSAVFSLVVSVLGSDFVTPSSTTKFATSDQSNVCLGSVRILRSYYSAYRTINIVISYVDT